MQYYLAFILLIGFVGTAHATIETSPFDINVTSSQFFEPNINKFQLVMKPGDSQEIKIDITNNDSKTQTINLQMAIDGPRPGRSFVFGPDHLEIKPGKTETSILTVSVSKEASTGTTIWHTLIAKSTTFGAKSFGFYLEVSEDISTPLPDMVRRGHPGSMFQENTRFDITEEEAIDQVPYPTLPPKLPEEYSFQGTYGERSSLIYAKQLVSSDTEEFDFWDNGGLLISFLESDELSFDEYLNYLSAGEQQVRINGKNTIASESKLIEKTTDNEIYSSSRVTVYLKDHQLRLTAQMPLEQLLQIAESMIINEGKDSNTEFVASNYRFIEFSYQNKVGEPIRFILEKTAKNECNSYKATITDKDGDIVWKQQRDSLCVVADTSSLRTSQIKLGFNAENQIIPEKSSKYMLRVEIDGGVIEREFVARNNFSGFSIDRTVYPVDWESKNPLKQFLSGVPFEEIQCRENLVLIKKYDESPACVKPSSINKMIDRGWANKEFRTPPIQDLQSEDRILRETMYLGLMMLLPHVDDGQTVAVSLEGRTSIVSGMVQRYEIEILSNKQSKDESTSNIFGKITKTNLQKFFEDESMNSFAKRGVLLISLGGYQDDTGVYGPFNQFLSEEEGNTIGEILQYYKDKRMNQEEIEWQDFVEWPTGIIDDGFVKALELHKIQNSCEEFSGVWNKEFATCFGFSENFDCVGFGGTLEDQSRTSETANNKEISGQVCMFKK